MTHASSIAKALMLDADLQARFFVLDLDGYRIAVKSNNEHVLETLEAYFAHALGDPSVPADITVYAIEQSRPNLGLEFTDWKREPGKSGRKDAFHDLEDGRLVQKVRTGMVFLQHEEHRFAAGPCLDNDNQVINFINAQYMNWLQQNGALICHASGLVVNGQCLAMAGFSGGGKSTLMLNALNQDGTCYLTNDRLFLQRTGDQVLATGIPKLPRINPGTILHNDRLHSILPPSRLAELRDMERSALWDLEEKYDVDVEALFHHGKIQSQAPFKAFLILNWDRDGSDPLSIQPVDLKERRELLKGVMKSPGPFYQFADGSFLRDDMPLDEAPYLDLLEGITILEATGRIDFDAAARYCLEFMS